MMNKNPISPHDIELLSAYLDGQLDQHQKAALEARLRTQPVLRTHLDELQKTRLMLRSLPQLRAPHNFTISPHKVGDRYMLRLPALFGAVSALSSAILILLVIGSLLLGNASQRLSGPAMVEDVQLMSVESDSGTPTQLAAPIAMQQVEVATEPMLGGGFSPSADSSRSAESTPDVVFIPEILSPTATPEVGLMIEIEGIATTTPTPTITPTPTVSSTPVTPSPTPTNYEVALPEIQVNRPGAQPLPEETAAKVIEPPASTPVYPLSIGLLVVEIVLAGIAGLSGFAALILFTRARR
jgi:hypothetical protein